ncbi:unnamed protein product, partial [marine sediment metagenome]
MKKILLIILFVLVFSSFCFAAEQRLIIGTVVFTDIAYNTFKDLLGYDCKEVKIEETEERVK